MRPFEIQVHTPTANYHLLEDFRVVQKLMGHPLRALSTEQLRLVEKEGRRSQLRCRPDADSVEIAEFRISRCCVMGWEK